MKALGIVSEYNPFHNGHKYQITKALEESGADVLIAIMSGNFVERGEPAILSKWERAKLAILNDVDIVIELPTVFSISSAGNFAKGGISILEALKCKYISFGVEETDSNKLIVLSNFLKENEEDIENYIKVAKSDGFSYPKARENYIKDRLGSEYIDVLNKPNNILAIEYLKNIKKAIPIFVSRHMVNHNGEFCEDYASGSYLRKMIIDGKEYKKFLPYDYDFKNIAYDNLLFPEIQSLAMHSTNDYLNSIFGAEEGLGDIIKNKYRYWNNYSDIIIDLKSKRYTETRIKRVLLSMLLGITKNDVNNASLYARVLGFNKKGQEYLNYLKKQNLNIPIITNINKQNTSQIEHTLKFDIKSSDLYNKITGKNLYENSDFVIMTSRF